MQQALLQKQQLYHPGVFAAAMSQVPFQYQISPQISQFSSMGTGAIRGLPKWSKHPKSVLIMDEVDGLLLKGVTEAVEEEAEAADADWLVTRDGHVFHQPRSYKPTHSMGEEFLSRFTRNAGLVASGVARNIHKVGNYIKDSLDDILYPYRRRPK